MMILVSVIVIVCLILAAFIYGMHIAEYYTDQRDRAVDYALKKQFARLQAGVDADDTAQPYVSPEYRIEEGR